MAISFKGAHFPQDIILMGVRWYVAYPLSTRHVEELMVERGVPRRSLHHQPVGHQIQPAAGGGLPPPQAAGVGQLADGRDLYQGQRRVALSVSGRGQVRQTIDFLLTEHRDTEAALRFLKKAIRRHGLPETITIDGSDANEAAIKRYNEEHGTAIIIRQVKYFNNIVEQDHRAVKRVTRPMLGFKSFEAAQATLAGIELMHMLKKRQMLVEEGPEGLTAAEQFYALAA